MARYLPWSLPASQFVTHDHAARCGCLLDLLRVRHSEQGTLDLMAVNPKGRASVDLVRSDDLATNEVMLCELRDTLGECVKVAETSRRLRGRRVC